jgi:valyl-tRNA synthetase
MAKVRLYMNEDVKSKQTAQYVLWDVLEHALRLLHPFMPFITEELWQQLKVEGETIMLQAFPKADESQISEEIEKSMNWLQEAITAFRNIRAEANINPGKEVPALVRTNNAEEIKILENNKSFLMKLAKLSSLDFGADIQKPDLSGFRVVGKSELIVPLLGLLDTEAEKKKILDQIAKLEN